MSTNRPSQWNAATGSRSHKWRRFQRYRHHTASWRCGAIRGSIIHPTWVTYNPTAGQCEQFLLALRNYPPSSAASYSHFLAPIDSNARMTNIGPLTTVFSAPESCTVAVGDCYGPSCFASYGYGCYGTRIEFDPACWPSGSALLPSSNTISKYFSPALDCPAGWATVTIGQDTDMFPGIASTQIGVLCCPLFVTSTSPCNHLNADH